MQQQEQAQTYRYRLSFLRVYALTSLAAALGFLAMMVGIYSIYSSLLEPGRWFGLMAPFVLGGMLTEAFLSWMMTRPLLNITSQEVDVYSIWGRRYRVRWEDIRSVKHQHRLGLPYLQLMVQDRGALYLPLYPANRREFLRHLANLVPSDHPVRHSLNL